LFGTLGVVAAPLSETTASPAAPPRGARREQILDAATTLFSRQGYHATSMQDLAEATGILRGSLYAHIRAKEDLLYDIVTRAAAEFLGRLEAVAESDARPEDKLRAALRAHVEVLAGNLEAARVFHHEWRALDEPRRDEVSRLRDRYEALWDRILAEGIRRRAFRAADASEVRLFVLGAANWIYTWYHPGGRLSPDQVAERLADLVVRGLAPRGR